MNTNTNQIVDKSLGEEDAAWNDFLFNVPLARQLLAEVDKGAARAILAAGERWQASGLTTTQASTKLWDVAKLALVTSGQGKEYLNCWLFAFPPSWQIEISELHLSDGAGKAAFHLRELLLAEEDDEEDDSEHRLP